jgi:hypothetical protein
MRGSYTSEAIAKEVHNLLTFINTKHRLLGITCDNAGNNSTLATHLEI